MEIILVLLDVLAGRLFEGLIAFFQELFANTRDKFISTTTWVWTWDQITLIFWVRCKEVETFWSCREAIQEAVQEQLENSLHIVLSIGWITLFYLFRSALAPLFSSNFRFFMAFYAILPLTVSSSDHGRPDRGLCFRFHSIFMKKTEEGSPEEQNTASKYPRSRQPNHYQMTWLT